MKRVCALCCDDPVCAEHVQLEERMARCDREGGEAV